jgi:hypothetical protein
LQHTVKVIASEHTPMGIPGNVKVQHTGQTDLPQIGGSGQMATQLCQKCKQAHPGRACDYDEKGECAETVGVNEVAQPRKEPSRNKED